MAFFGEQKRNCQLSILYIIARKEGEGGMGGGGGIGVFARFCFDSDSVLAKKKQDLFTLSDD